MIKSLVFLCVYFFLSLFFAFLAGTCVSVQHRSSKDKSHQMYLIFFLDRVPRLSCERIRSMVGRDSGQGVRPVQ